MNSRMSLRDVRRRGRTAALMVTLALGLATAVTGSGRDGTATDGQAPVAAAQPVAPSRGEYLATIMDCAGCHTGGALAGRPDPKLHLAGSDIGFELPGFGYVYPPNLTPDRETGLGGWSQTDIVRAIRTGQRPDGRILAPVMPWHNYALLTDADAYALAGYLRGLPPLRHRAPQLTGAGEPAPAPYLTVVTPPAR